MFNYAYVKLATESTYKGSLTFQIIQVEVPCTDSSYVFLLQDDIKCQKLARKAQKM